MLGDRNITVNEARRKRGAHRGRLPRGRNRGAHAGLWPGVTKAKWSGRSDRLNLDHDPFFASQWFGRRKAHGKEMVQGQAWRMSYFTVRW